MRAKHCQTCKHCVRRYDHHCPWIENCVGERNHRWFVIYLLVQLLALLWAFHVALYVCTIRFYIETFPLSGQWDWYLFGRSGISPSDTWDLWFRSNSFLLASLVIVGVFSVVVMLLLGCHFYLVSINCTTWEFMSRHRISYLKHCDSEHSPFDRGVFCNLWDFFCICRTVVWEQTYLRNNTSSIWPQTFSPQVCFHMVTTRTFVLMNQWLFWWYEKEALFYCTYSLCIYWQGYIKWSSCCL